MYRKSGDGYAKPIDGIEFKTIVHGANTLMAEFHLSAGAVLPLHSHPHEQSTIVLFGELEFVLGEETQTLKAGELVVIPGGVEHFVKVGPVPARVLDVFVPVREDLKY